MNHNINGYNQAGALVATLSIYVITCFALDMDIPIWVYLTDFVAETTDVVTSFIYKSSLRLRLL